MKNPQKRRKKWCVGPEKVVRKPWDWKDQRMKTISIDIPDKCHLSGLGLGKKDEEFARGLRLAAAIFWYDKGLISQGSGTRW